MPVYGGTIFAREGTGEQQRAIALCGSKVALHRALVATGFSVTKRELKSHWTVTANSQEVAAAHEAGDDEVLVRGLSDWNGKFRSARKDAK